MACAVAAGATVVAFAAPARAADQIEGSWLFENGEVLVEATGPGTFKGTVVKPTRFTACTHPVGQVMWQIAGSGGNYSGTHIWYTSECAENPGGQSTWLITSTDPANYTLRFCTVVPGGGPPTFDPPGNPAGTPTGGTRCHDLMRTLPPQPRRARSSRERADTAPASRSASSVRRVTGPVPETPKTASLWRRAVRAVAIDAALLRRRRDFRLLVVGQAVSEAGSMLTFVAVPFQVYELTGSSLAVGPLRVAEFAPIPPPAP